MVQLGMGSSQGIQPPRIKFPSKQRNRYLGSVSFGAPWNFSQWRICVRNWLIGVPAFVLVCWSSYILHTSSDLWGRRLLVARVELPITQTQNQEQSLIYCGYQPSRSTPGPTIWCCGVSSMLPLSGVEPKRSKTRPISCSSHLRR